MFQYVKTIGFLYINWIAISLVTFVYTGVLDDFGPKNWGPTSDITVFPAVSMVTYSHWVMVILFVFFNTFISSLAKNSVDPWIINKLQDDNVADLGEFAPRFIIISVMLYRVAQKINFIFFLFISLSRPDMLISQVLSESIVQFVITRSYIKRKELLNTFNYIHP
jgi:hypothetical protein